MSEDSIKSMLRRMPYGFYSITSKHGDEVNAMVANWIVQTSFEPRMLALGLQRTSYSYELISKGKVFAVNLFLRQDDEAIKPFTKSRLKNPEKMSGVDYSPAPETGCPIILGAAGYLECQVKEIFTTGGDHDIILGEVIGAQVLKEGSVDDTLTLLDLGWSYAG
jgi:flavin reductase (DIM6/NTAB) family NADH-FMN oxidoreductase RutF